MNITRKVKLPILDIRQFYVFPQLFVENLRAAVGNRAAAAAAAVKATKATTTTTNNGHFLLRHDIAKTPKNLAKQQIQEVRHFFLHGRIRKLSVGVHHHRTFRGYYDFNYKGNNNYNDNDKTTTCYCENLRLGAVYSYQEFGATWPPYERLKGVNPVTGFQPSLRYISGQYAIEMRRISEHLREAFSMALGLPRIEYEHFITPKPHWFLNLSKFHPSSSSSSSFRQPTGHRSCSSIDRFEDTNLFSLTLQDGMTAGLQLQSNSCQDGEEVTWLDAGKIHPDYLICSVGKQMEVLSNGFFQSCPNRVMVKGMRSLLVVSYGYNPSLETTIHAVPMQKQGNSVQKDQTRQCTSRDPLQVGDYLFWNLAKMHPAAFHSLHPSLEILDDGRILQKEPASPEDNSMRIRTL